MKVYVNAIPPEGVDIEENLEPASLNLETEQTHFSEGLKVRARLEKDGDILTVNCSVKGTKRQICSRCLSEFDIPIEKEINFVYELSGEYAIELDDKIKDEIILDYPLKILCKPDCKGLCPRCGKNLNEGPCGCERQTKD